MNDRMRSIKCLRSGDIYHPDYSALYKIWSLFNLYSAGAATTIDPKDVEVTLFEKKIVITSMGIIIILPSIFLSD